MKRTLVSIGCAAALLLAAAADLPAPTFPSLAVTKQCSPPATAGGEIPFSGVVANNGFFPVTGVTVVDDNGTPGLPGDDYTVLSVGLLNPGDSAPFSGSYLPQANPSTNTVTATGTFDGAVVTATASATCGWTEGGCTLTPGYWKTHSKYGPAPYDATWGDLEDEGFFLSGMTYYQVMWREPNDSPYFSLAHHFIAAYLNTLKGASMPAEVQAVFDEALALFQTYAPGQVSKRGGGGIKAQFTAAATALDNYNNGVTGPGHCDKK